nr:TPA_asm: m105.5 sORF [Murid betaherpesvirus 1]DBA08058.1 TPA_asm: m105.5 sORF [Murid betaherpesvirus 1]
MKRRVTSMACAGSLMRPAGRTNLSRYSTCSDLRGSPNSMCLSRSPNSRSRQRLLLMNMTQLWATSQYSERTGSLMSAERTSMPRCTSRFCVRWS